jgi:hypothetical protein
VPSALTAAAGFALLGTLAACGGDAPAPDSAAVAPYVAKDARDRAAGESSNAKSTPASGATAACVSAATDAWTPPPMGAATFVVNRGTRGMSSTIRWMLSPDSAAIIVTDDPVGIENEPVPDGVLYATERTGRTWRMDSVWSAAPSPDWRRIAFGRAVFLRGGEEQRIPSSAWEAPARRLRALAGDEPTLRGDSLRAHSYPVSGMGVAEGAGVTMVVNLDSLPAAQPRFVALDGWRVWWSCDARSVFVADRPARVENGGAPAGTRRVPVPPGSAPSTATPSPVPWIEGPTLTIGVPFDSAARPLTVRGRTIESRAGRVVLRETDGAGHTRERDVGPGVPLAATRSGRFILALAPRPNAVQHDSPEHAVVYRVP